MKQLMNLGKIFKNCSVEVQKVSNPSVVSIVVPTKNSENTINSCLKSIKEQTYPDIEIIIVDNHSSDKTREIAQKYGKVLLKGPERSTQRNFGAQFARGNYVFFIDSDMELTPKVVDDCVKAAVCNHANAVVVPEVSIGEGFWTKCKALERSCYIGDDTIEAARFFEKDVFFGVGRFDEEITGQEDWDLQVRIAKVGFRIARINSFIRHNEGRLSLQKTMMKKRNYGKTLKIYTKKHPKEAGTQMTLIRPAFIRNWKKLAKDPVHAIGMLVMKVCEFGAASVGFF
jgi:glycosyltransferase involved in cell wall biosynthesis